MDWNTIQTEDMLFEYCPFCRKYPEIREATEEERNLFPNRVYRLSHRCDKLDCILYGKSKRSLSYDWKQFLGDSEEKK